MLGLILLQLPKQKIAIRAGNCLRVTFRSDPTKVERSKFAPDTVRIRKEFLYCEEAYAKDEYGGVTPVQHPAKK